MSKIDEYIETFPNEVQILLNRVRKTIKESAPDAEETMSYGVPAFKQNGNLVVYAAFKRHIGLYPTPSGIEAFKKELRDYETSKGTIKFPFDKDIPYDLIKRIVKFRIKENQQN